MNNVAGWDDLIVLNTEEVGVCGAADEIRMAWAKLRDRLREPGVHRDPA